MDLQVIAQEIREIVQKKREELELVFYEDKHQYIMKDVDGNLRSDFPSVSKVLKKFYTEFPAEEIALKKEG
jgi:hypothetical protein